MAKQPAFGPSRETAAKLAQFLRAHGATTSATALPFSTLLEAAVNDGIQRAEDLLRLIVDAISLGFIRGRIQGRTENPNRFWVE